jgi:predicted dehydrogenase
VNVLAGRILASAAIAARVRRLVAVSSIAVHREKLSTYASTKHEMERVALASGLPSVVLRPTLVYGPGEGGLFGRMVQTMRRLPVVPVIGSGRQRMRPIHVDDVVDAIMTSLDADDAVGRCYDLVGPDETTLGELLERIASTIGVRRRLVRVPRPIVKTGVRVLSAVRIGLPVSVDNVDGADEPTPSDPPSSEGSVATPRVGLAEGMSTANDPFPPLDGGPRPVRVVVAGLGKMGLAHLTLLAAIREAVPVGAVEVDRRLGRAVRRMGFSIPCFTSLERAMDALRPDAVVIATPTDTHAELARMAAERGVSVFVEKPLARDLESAEELAGMLDASGITSACGYTLAYLPAFERVKELLEAGALGDIEGFRASMQIGQVLGPKRGWMYDAARSGGGVLSNVASHALFLLHWYLGEVVEVRATTRSLHTAVDDEATVGLRFAGGASGELAASWSVPGLATSRTTIEIWGSNGSVRADNDGVKTELIEARAGMPAGTYGLTIADLPHPGQFDLGGEGYCRELEDFARAVRDGHRVRATIDRAVHVQAALDAAYRSASRDGEAVMIATPTKAVAV